MATAPHAGVYSGVGNPTRGDYTVSDRNTWKIIGTLVVLFCLWQGIQFWKESKAAQAEAEMVRRLYKELYYRNDHAAMVDIGRGDVLQYFRNQDARELEEKQFRAKYGEKWEFDYPKWENRNK